MALNSEFVLRRARLHTMTGQTGATALAVRDGTIVAVGTEDEASSAVRSGAPSIDLGHRHVLPGFIDAHLHWTGYALMRRQLALEPAMGLGDVLRRVRTRVAASKPDEWLLGRGWDHHRWGRWPTAADLDAVSDDHPVALTRKDGHVVWVNSAALRAAKIGPDTVDPAGGEILRDEQGPTGILKEAAIRLINDVVPEPPRVERQAALIDAWPDAWSQGITAAHDMGYKEHNVFLDLATLRDAGELGLRITWYLQRGDLDEAIGLGLRSGLGDHWLRVGGLKLFIDGTLGSQTAQLLAPYEGQIANRGLEVLDDDAFHDLVTRAAEAGLASAVHAIGDAAVHRSLDVLSSAPRRPRIGGGLLRHRIEHAQLVDPSDYGRFAASGITVSMQPRHCTADAQVADLHWGARAEHSYPWRSLLDAGAHLAFGSDAPVESLSVVAGLHAAVTRQQPDGWPTGGWHSEERITIQEAIFAYTMGAARAVGLEDQIGSLQVGKKADIIVLGGDPFTMRSDHLPNLAVLGTMIDGLWVWQAPGIDLGGPRQASENK